MVNGKCQIYLLGSTFNLVPFAKMNLLPVFTQHEAPQPKHSDKLNQTLFNKLHYVTFDLQLLYTINLLILKTFEHLFYVPHVSNHQLRCIDDVYYFILHVLGFPSLKELNLLSVTWSLVPRPKIILLLPLLYVTQYEAAARKPHALSVSKITKK